MAGDNNPLSYDHSVSENVYTDETSHGFVSFFNTSHLLHFVQSYCKIWQVVLTESEWCGLILTYSSSFRPPKKSLLVLAFKNSVQALVYLYICVHERAIPGEKTLQRTFDK